MNNINKVNILFKAKNSFAYLFASSIYACYCFALAFVIYLVSIKHTFLYSVYLIMGLIVVGLLFIVPAWIDYFSDSLAITNNCIISQNKNSYRVIPFSEVRYIKKESQVVCTPYSLHKPYTLIKSKDNEEIICVSIRNYKEFIEKIKIIYPEFTNDEGIIEQYDDDINRYLLGAFLLPIFIASLGQELISDKGLVNNVSLICWLAFAFIVCCWLYSIMGLIIQIKNRYFSEKSKKMIKTIKDSLPDSDTSIITNYCPLCGDKLEDYKCNSCYISLENIYKVKNNFCIKCGKERNNCEIKCSSCGLSFNNI